jgi:hypothetical protein
MNTKVEVLLILLALAGLFSAMPKDPSKPYARGNRVEQTVIIADGSDPMPLCRNKRVCGD